MIWRNLFLDQAPKYDGAVRHLRLIELPPRRLLAILLISLNRAMTCSFRHCLPCLEHTLDTFSSFLHVAIESEGRVHSQEVSETWYWLATETTSTIANDPLRSYRVSTNTHCSENCTPTRCMGYPSLGTMRESSSCDHVAWAFKLAHICAIWANVAHSLEHFAHFSPQCCTSGWS